MRKKIEWEWETLDASTQRVKVIGGWIVMRLGATDIEKNKRVQFKESILFISDIHHEWQIIPPLQENKPTKNIAAGFESPKVEK